MTLMKLPEGPEIIRQPRPAAAADAPPMTVDSRQDDARLTLHPSTSPEPGLLIKLEPPRLPPGRIFERGCHMPCDIVLCIDVSGSMSAPAPVPGAGPEEEHVGLSVLDLAKHAARTIIETLDRSDRLGIVSFASRSVIQLGLISMTDENKDRARRAIDTLSPRDYTNLWAAIAVGLGLFQIKLAAPARASALMVLTDGRPNMMCPPRGYIPSLGTMSPLPAAIHTFGFGYALRSGLLKSVAEFGGGNYSFISDAGMIGTVFIHAVANLQATFAATATVTITGPARLRLEVTTGDSTDGGGEAAAAYPGDGEELRRLVIPLGAVQYGQSRDMWVKAAGVTPVHVGVGGGGGEEEEADKYNKGPVRVEVELSRPGAYDPVVTLRGSCTLGGPAAGDGLDPAELAHHRARSAVIEFLASMLPVGPDGERVSVASTALADKRAELDLLAESIPASDPLRADLVGEEPRGQVAIALSSAGHWIRWGRHYLPSLLSAHARQVCNSFKDPGPLTYGAGSPLFLACRHRLDEAFNSLPAPEPSLHDRDSDGGRGGGRGRGGAMATTPAVSFSMASYNNANTVCFAAATGVRMASGATRPIRTLRRHDLVETLLGPREVVSVLRQRVKRLAMAQLPGGAASHGRSGQPALLATPWHPVSGDGKTWWFPVAVPGRRRVAYTGSIYSVMLEPDDHAAAHSIQVNGYWGATLGHGLIGGLGAPESVRDDARAHGFLGSYYKVASAIARLGPGRDGLVASGGVRRCGTTGLVIGFKRTKKSRRGRARRRRAAAAAAAAAALEGAGAGGVVLDETELEMALALEGKDAGAQV